MSGQENVKWVDGLRGIASLLVVFTHIARSLDDRLFLPSDGENVSPRVLQYPILRIFIQGRIGVTIFSLVTGYVCALKPIRQIRAGNPEAAFSTVSRSAFRRIPRLLMPTTIATTGIWFICQFGVFAVGNRVNSWWINYTSPGVTPYFGEAVKSLLYHSITTWTRSWNIYDNNQWTLLPLLKGSMLVYIFLLATAYAKTRYRMMIEVGLFVYYYICNDSSFGMQVFFGAFLCDLSQHPPHQAYLQAHKWPARYLSPVLIALGLVFASYPEGKQEFVPWSKFMQCIATYIFPKDSDFPRFYSGIGLECIALGIHFSPSIRSILSSKYLLWFGKNSFAVYLLHGTLMRTLMVWMLFGVSLPSDVVNAEGQMVPGPPLQMRGKWRFFFWMPIWFVIVYFLANLWTKYVDPWCARMTQKLEAYVFVEPDSGPETFEKRVLPK